MRFLSRSDQGQRKTIIPLIHLRAVVSEKCAIAPLTYRRRNIFLISTRRFKLGVAYRENVTPLVLLEMDSLVFLQLFRFQELISILHTHRCTGSRGAFVIDVSRRRSLLGACHVAVIANERIISGVLVRLLRFQIAKRTKLLLSS